MKSALDVALLNAEGLEPRIHRYLLFCVKDASGSQRLVVRVAPRDDPRDAVVERFAHEVVDLTFETIGGGEFTYRPHACDLVLLCGQSSDIQPETDRTATAAIFARALTGFRVSAL